MRDEPGSKGDGVAGRAFVGLGSNLGDRTAAIASALRALGAVPGLRIATVSHVYESEPWGVADQPPFANAVAELDCALTVRELLAACKRIEREMGREPGQRLALARSTSTCCSSAMRRSRSRTSSSPTRAYWSATSS